MHLSPTPLRTFRLVSGRYELDKSESPALESIGLGVRLWEGEYEDMHLTWLRWTTADGQLLPTGKEKASSEAIRAESEKQRADAETQRADAETRRADEAVREATLLKAKLRQLGIDT